MTSDDTQNIETSSNSNKESSPSSSSWVTRWSYLRYQQKNRYLVGLALFVIALLSRFFIASQLPPGFPFLTFFPAVVVTTFLCGRGPGILCAVLSFFSSWYFFISPFDSFGLDLASAVALSFFVIVIVVDIFVIDTMVATQKKLEQERQTISDLLAQQRSLFHELQHRVSNNMAIVGTVLATQQRRLSHLPEAVKGFGEARDRFEVLARVHRQLYDPDLGKQNFGHYLHGLCQDSLSAVACPVDLIVEVEDIEINTQQRLNIAVLTLELVTNAIKHAFSDNAKPQLKVELKQKFDESFILQVTDNGPGLPSNFDLSKTDRLGIRVIAGLVKSARGTIDINSSSKGCVFIISFPVKFFKD